MTGGWSSHRFPSRSAAAGVSNDYLIDARLKVVAIPHGLDAGLAELATQMSNIDVDES
jgi:hypothetical protein